MLEAYLITLAGVVLAQAAPGPNFLAVASAGLGQGRKAALFTVCGVATGMLVWAASVAFGLAAVLAIYPTLLSAMKIIGGAYLLFMAFRALLASWRGQNMSVGPMREPLTPFAAWRRGLLVIMTNPKAALMWAGVATFLFGSGLSTVQVLAFGPVAMISALLIYGVYGLAFSSAPAIRAYQRFARVIEAMLGAAFGFLGGKLFLDGMRELRG